MRVNQLVAGRGIALRREGGVAVVRRLIGLRLSQDPSFGISCIKCFAQESVYFGAEKRGA